MNFIKIIFNRGLQMKKLTSIQVSKDTYETTPITKRMLLNFVDEINLNVFIRLNLNNFGKIKIVRVTTPSKDQTFKIVRRKK